MLVETLNTNNMKRSNQTKYKIFKYFCQRMYVKNLQLKKKDKKNQYLIELYICIF